MVKRFWTSLLAALFLYSSAAAAAEEVARQYRLSHALARPVVRILSDENKAQGQYGSATGVLVGRCDIVLTAKHVAMGKAGFKAQALDVYSPQIRGKGVRVLEDADARALWPSGGGTPKEGNFDADLAVLKLSACPTHSYVPMDQIRPVRFSDLKALKTVGFACDSGDKRAPEMIAMRGVFQQAPPGLGVSRSIVLTPGARSGQSGSPIYALEEGEPPALTMIMAATLRKNTAPIGCGKDPSTGRSKAGLASYGAVLSSDFIEALAAYVRGLNARDLE